MKHATGADKHAQDKLRSGGEIPTHIAIIMDGNGRWAKKRSLPRIAGHQAGVESVRDIVEVCGQLGVKYLTLYAFSTENWKRPTDEVSVLMKLLLKYLKSEVKELNESNVRLEAIGQLNALPKRVQQQLFESIDALKKNKGLVLNLALSYSGRSDIARAVQMLALDIRRGKISPEDIDEDAIRSFLSTSYMPDPDLLIRTSGEKRISNFMLWECAYSEIVFTDTFWPEFRRQHLYEAIAEYQTRERRFGRTSEQTKESRPSYVQRMLNALVG
ncbi:MAG TPA: isoprenyl transferase [Candidatus Kapabacteria bacterium]|nr:isoprenyl transferase [Candidatus Kapabacteria bacterium]